MFFSVARLRLLVREHQVRGRAREVRNRFHRAQLERHQPDGRQAGIAIDYFLLSVVVVCLILDVPTVVVLAMSKIGGNQGFPCLFPVVSLTSRKV